MQELRTLRGKKFNVIHNSLSELSVSTEGPDPFSRVGLSCFFVVVAATVGAGEV